MSAEDLIDPNVGLLDGHNFVDATSNEDIQYTCLSCHAGSIAGCFTDYDVHGPAGAGMSCMACHSGTYRTCESCHGWMAETRGDVPIEMHEGLYLGYDLGNGKITTLVKAPVDGGVLRHISPGATRCTALFKML